MSDTGTLSLHFGYDFNFGGGMGQKPALALRTASEQLNQLLQWLPRSGRIQIGKLAQTLIPTTINKTQYLKAQIWLENLSQSKVTPRQPKECRRLADEFLHIWPEELLENWSTLLALLGLWINQELVESELKIVLTTLQRYRIAKTAEFLDVLAEAISSLATQDQISSRDISLIGDALGRCTQHDTASSAASRTLNHLPPGLLVALRRAIVRVLRRSRRHLIQQNRTRFLTTDHIVDLHPRPVAILVSREITEQLSNAIRNLSPIDREIIELQLAGTHHNAIAQIIGVSPATICRRLKQSLDLLIASVPDL